MPLIDYQQSEQLKKTPAPVGGNFATVAAVYDDGISLILPGTAAASAKHYVYNASCQFSPGQRVHIARENGTIIVEYPLSR